MGDDQIVVGDQGGEGFHRHLNMAFLDLGQGLLPPFKKGIASQGGDDQHLGRPIVATMSALMVCSLFSD